LPTVTHMGYTPRTGHEYNYQSLRLRVILLIMSVQGTGIPEYE